MNLDSLLHRTYFHYSVVQFWCSKLHRSHWALCDFMVWGLCAMAVPYIISKLVRPWCIIYWWKCSFMLLLETVDVCDRFFFPYFTLECLAVLCGQFLGTPCTWCILWVPFHLHWINTVMHFGWLIFAAIVLLDKLLRWHPTVVLLLNSELCIISFRNAVLDLLYHLYRVQVTLGSYGQVHYLIVVGTAQLLFGR